MQFRKTKNTATVAQHITAILQSHLDKGERVLWLVPGGSSIAIAAEVSKKLTGNLEKLHITLTDERFGNIGHPDSNWQQLIEAGFIMNRATIYPVLSGIDKAETTQRFAQTLTDLLENTDYRVGFFGMGADGHIAGVLPDSPAVIAKELATSYTAPGFERITMTPVAIKGLDEAVLYAVGEAKQVALDNLDKTILLNEQPAQILKQVKNVTIFNDYKGEDA